MSIKDTYWQTKDHNGSHIFQVLSEEDSNGTIRLLHLNINAEFEYPFNSLGFYCNQISADEAALKLLDLLNNE